MDNTYAPVSCSLHDELLELATFRKNCTVSIEDASGQIEEVTAFIQDVYTKDGAEYMKLDDQRVVRLDQIKLLNGRTAL